jgi:hypothetical protein
MRSRVMTGIAVATAVVVGGVGGALIGVPGLSGATPFDRSAATTAAPGIRGGARLGENSPLIKAAATALKLTPQQLLDKLSDGKTTIADVAKAQGVAVSDVVKAMTDADATRIGDIVNKPWPQRPAPGTAPAFGPGGPGMRGGFGFGFARASLDAVAQALGITTDELKTDLGNGQTIAQIATAKGLKVDDVINTLVTDATKKIDQAVTDKHLDATRAAKLKDMLKTAITNLVNNGLPKGPMGGFMFPGGRGHRGPNFGPGFGGAGSGSGSTSTTKPPTA